eukprot:m.71438 g.71438  ORF g.71438 m.71438 type:complete len:106 (+) comp35741_c0_seq5:363-680(+)
MREMEKLQEHENAFIPALAARCSSISSSNDDGLSQMKFECQMLKRSAGQLKKKEARIKELLKIWGDKPEQEQDFKMFFRAVRAASYSTGSRFKTRAKLLKQVRPF